MGAFTIWSDFGAPQNKVCHCFHSFPIYLPWSDGTRCHDLRFLNVPYCYLKILKPKVSFQWHFLVTGRYKHSDYRWTSFFQHCIVCIYTKTGWPDPPESVCLWNWSKIHAFFGRLSHKRIFPGFDSAKNIKRIYLVAL